MWLFESLSPRTGYKGMSGDCYPDTNITRATPRPPYSLKNCEGYSDIRGIINELTNVDSSKGIVELDIQREQIRRRRHLEECIGEEGTNWINPLFPYIFVLLSTPTPLKLDVRATHGRGWHNISKTRVTSAVHLTSRVFSRDSARNVCVRLVLHTKTICCFFRSLIQIDGFPCHASYHLPAHASQTLAQWPSGIHTEGLWESLVLT